METISLGEILIHKISIPDWKDKKETLMKLVPESHFLQGDTNSFTDFYYTTEMRNRSGNHPYADKFFETIDWYPEKHFGSDCFCKDLWCVRYGHGGGLHIHDHFWGMSGILYANFDPVFNKATSFVSPIRKIWDHYTVTVTPPVEEGDLVLFPSALMHYADPNMSDTERLLFSFNVKKEGYIG